MSKTCPKHVQHMSKTCPTMAAGPRGRGAAGLRAAHAILPADYKTSIRLQDKHQMTTQSRTQESLENKLAESHLPERQAKNPIPRLASYCKTCLLLQDLPPAPRLAPNCKTCLQLQDMPPLYITFVLYSGQNTKTSDVLGAEEGLRRNGAVRYCI